MSTIRTDVDHVESGAWSFTGTVALPSTTIDQNNIKAATLFPAENVEHRFPVGAAAEQASGAAVAAKTNIVHIAKYAGTIEDFTVGVDTAPTTTDTVTIDFQKSTGGGAWATVLTGTVGFSSSDADRTTNTGTLAVTSFAAGDMLRVVTTVSGTSAQGLLPRAILHENPSA